jgi:hypothetical protein
MATTALLWAVHGDFLRYMSRIEDGQIAVINGAEQLPDGGFRFPVMGPTDAPDDSAAGQRAQSSDSTRFRGSVVCTGHHGMLVVTIAAPELLRQDGTTALVIDDPFSPGERMPMAHLRPSSQDPRQFATRLSEEGADLFQGVYATGMALAPVRLEQDIGRAPHAPTGTAPSAATRTPTDCTIASTEDSP